MHASIRIAAASIFVLQWVCFTAPAYAAEPAAGSCESKAVSKAGKPLAGAAKATFMKKCEAGGAAPAAASGASACESKAVSKAGKPLFGAAKAASIKKCEADAKAGT